MGRYRYQKPFSSQVSTHFETGLQIPNYMNHTVLATSNTVNFILEPGFVISNLGKTIHLTIVKTSNLQGFPITITITSPYINLNDPTIRTLTLSSGPGSFNFEIHTSGTNMGPYVEVVSMQGNLNP